MNGLKPAILDTSLILVNKNYKRDYKLTRYFDPRLIYLRYFSFYFIVGHLVIKARLKELIKVKGYQVPPAELEALLRTHNDILDVAVTGEPHPTFGEIPMAYVVSKPGVKPNEDDIMNFVAERVAKYKRLGSVKFVDAIPKNTTGKILRRELKNL